jgi:hypothetical protein
VPTVIVPGEHTAVVPVATSGYTFRQSLAVWYQSVTGYYGAQYPHVDASARACVAHHAAHASKAPQSSAGYEVGAACPALGPENPHYGGFGVGDALVGWQTDWQVPVVPFLVSSYGVQVAQVTRVMSPLTFMGIVPYSPSWLAAAAAVLPAGQEGLAVTGAAVTTITATVTFAASSYVGTASIGVNVFRRTDSGADIWLSPGEAPGPTVGYFTASGGGETVDVPWDEVLTDQALWAFVASNSDTDLGAAPGATPGSGSEVTLARISPVSVTATFTGTVTYTDISIAGVPPLHAAQRRGGTDAHAAYARGADTRQSRLLARGPL